MYASHLPHSMTISPSTPEPPEPPPSSNPFNMGVPMLVFGIILLIAMIIAYPTAFGAYYSRCFKIKFTYGILMALAPVIILLLVATVPALYPLVWVSYFSLALVVIGAVFRQMQGKCSLSTLKNA